MRQLAHCKRKQDCCLVCSIYHDLPTTSSRKFLALKELPSTAILLLAIPGLLPLPNFATHLPAPSNVLTFLKQFSLALFLRSYLMFHVKLRTGLTGYKITLVTVFSELKSAASALREVYNKNITVKLLIYYCIVFSFRNT